MESAAKRKQLSALAVLLFLSFLIALAGCSKGKKNSPEPGDEWAEDLRARIEKYIQDPDKKNQLMDLVDQDMTVFKQLAQAAELNQKSLLDVDRNYHSTPEDFKKVFAEFNETRYRLRAESLEIRFQMKDLCTPEEWEGLSHFQTI